MCSYGYVYLPAHDAVTNPADSTCCHQMTCTNIDGKTDGSHADYQCPSGETAGFVALQGDALTAAEGVTSPDDEKCCHEKTCTDVDGALGDYVCPDGYTYVSANGDSKPPGYSNCCGETLSRFDPRAEYIDSICPHGHMNSFSDRGVVLYRCTCSQRVHVHHWQCKSCI